MMKQNKFFAKITIGKISTVKVFTKFTLEQERKKLKKANLHYDLYIYKEGEYIPPSEPEQTEKKVSPVTLKMAITTTEDGKTTYKEFANIDSALEMLFKLRDLVMKQKATPPPSMSVVKNK